jgi:hypothetical protein
MQSGPQSRQDCHHNQGRGGACPETFGEPHQVAIRILNEEFTPSALIVTDPIPSFVWLLIKRPFSTV